MKILIAEDDIDDIELMKEAIALKQSDFTADFVMNGVEVIEYLQRLKPEELPQLLILDLIMPKMNGIETLLAIKTLELAAIPVIVYCTGALPATIKKCYSLGALKVIFKPNNFKGILDFIDEINH